MTELPDFAQARRLCVPAAGARLVFCGQRGRQVNAATARPPACVVHCRRRRRRRRRYWRHLLRAQESFIYPFENEEYARCAACNCEVSMDERAYVFGREGVLCFDCAETRHGVYQEWLERWTVAPNIDDLKGTSSVDP